MKERKPYGDNKCKKCFDDKVIPEKIVTQGSSSKKDIDPTINLIKAHEMDGDDLSSDSVSSHQIDDESVALIVKSDTKTAPSLIVSNSLRSCSNCSAKFTPTSKITVFARMISSRYHPSKPQTTIGKKCADCCSNSVTLSWQTTCDNCYKKHNPKKSSEFQNRAACIDCKCMFNQRNKDHKRCYDCYILYSLNEYK